MSRQWVGFRPGEEPSKASCDEKPMLKLINALILLGCSRVELVAGRADTARALRNKQKKVTLSFKQKIILNERSD